MNMIDLLKRSQRFFVSQTKTIHTTQIIGHENGEKIKKQTYKDGALIIKDTTTPRFSIKQGYFVCGITGRF